MPGKAKAKSSKGPARDKQEAQLDEALDETFPASDPIATGHATSTEPPARPVDRKAPVIDADDVAAAQKPRKR